MKVNQMKQKHIFQAATRFCCALFLALALGACSNNAIYQQSKDLPNGIWEKDSAAVLPCYMSDSTGRYDVLIDLRNGTDYPYENLWLFVNLYNPKGEVFRDTLECMIYDFDGRPMGSGSGGKHHLAIQFLSGIQFQPAGKYKFEIIQGMRTDTLVGISDIGVRIVPTTGEGTAKKELEMQPTPASAKQASANKDTAAAAAAKDTAATEIKKDTAKKN